MVSKDSFSFFTHFYCIFSLVSFKQIQILAYFVKKKNKQANKNKTTKTLILL